MIPNPKHFHIIGICGVATGALAIALKEAGYKVTGSDKGFYPPVSTYLKEAGIEYYAGFHSDRMLGAERGETRERPDLIVVATAAGSQNPELLAARDAGIEIISEAEARGRFFAAENSIVTVGTWGKTTTSALLAAIFEAAGLKPSYMTGGIPIDLPPAKITPIRDQVSDKKNQSETRSLIEKYGWSILEGDEYKSAPWDDTPKFMYCKPTHLLLTSLSWDHADLYPTEEDYFDAFKDLLGILPANGLLVACLDNAGVRRLLSEADDRLRTRVVFYGAHPHHENSAAKQYTYSDAAQSQAGLSFRIRHGDDEFAVKSPLLGAYNAENITAAFAMAHQAGIEPDVITNVITSFRGIKRRLEKRHDGQVTVIDAHAPTADKARSNLDTLRELYTQKIIAVYEPNIGGRRRESAEQYDFAFTNADTVFVPRLTKLKKSASADVPMEGEELAEVIGKTHSNTRFLEDDEQLMQAVADTAGEGDLVVFLGSHGFRGMIEGVINKLQ